MNKRDPLVERLEKLALLIGSDAWSADQGPAAESLIREAALVLSRLKAEDAWYIDLLTTWSNSLREENSRLLKFCEMLEEENRRLRESDDG